MPYKRLQAAKQKFVGSKQTVKALKKNLAKVVYVADNADKHVVEPIIAICEEKQVPFMRVDSMQNLGKACGIKVECAVAAIIEEE
jgi:large subunit ribosomal protein L7A